MMADRGPFCIDPGKKFQGAYSPETSHFVLWYWSSHLARFMDIGQVK